jgi:stage II sporulation protein D
MDQTKWKNWIKKEYHKSDGNFMIREFTNDNRAKTVGFSFDDTKFKANEFRLKMIQSFGARSLKSLRFSLVQREDSVLFVGNGMGHGVGLCQWGALGFAEAGWKYHDILRFYYQGIEIKPVYFDSEKTYLELAQ